MIRATVIGGGHDSAYVFCETDEVPALEGYELYTVTGVNGCLDAHYLIPQRYRGDFRDAMIDATNERNQKLYALTAASTMPSLSEASVVAQEADRFRQWRKALRGYASCSLNAWGR